MTAINPTTGQELSETEEASRTIQRCLFQTPASTKVHVYNIPPLASNKGHDAATWTADGNKRMIFTARLRVLETAITPTTSTDRNPSSASSTESPGKPILRADILLEDPSTGALFASCPYVSSASVMQALGSSRFFALRVVGEGGMKATLGIGFEERADAFDFNTTLQDVRKLLGGFDMDASTGGKSSIGSGSSNDNKQAGNNVERGKFGDTFSKLNVHGKNNANDNNRIKVDLSAAERIRTRNSSNSTSEHRDNSESNAKRANKNSSAVVTASFSNQTGSSAGIPFLPPPPPPSSTSSARERMNRRRVKSNSGEPISNDEAASISVADSTFDDAATISSLSREDVGDDGDDDFGDFC